MKNESLQKEVALQILDDLQEKVIDSIDDDGIYEEIGNGQFQHLISDWIYPILDDLTEMVKQLGFENFKEFYLENYTKANQPDFAKEWSAALAETYEEIIREELKK